MVLSGLGPSLLSYTVLADDREGDITLGTSSIWIQGLETMGR